MLVTINTNRSPTTEAEREDLEQCLLSELEDYVFSVDGLGNLILFHEPGGRVLEADVSDAVIEQGPRMKRVHAHFVMSLLHTGHVNLAPMQRHWQEVLGQRLGFSVYVNIALLESSARKTYNLKDVTDEEVARRAARGVEVVF